MTHGEGHLRKCICRIPPGSKPGDPLGDFDPDCLQHRELRGPRNITSMNVERLFDDGGKRFLYIEEKRPNEGMLNGQKWALQHLAKVPQNTVWVAQGTPSSLTIVQLGEQGTPIRTVDGNWSTYQAEVDGWFAGGTP